LPFCWQFSRLIFAQLIYFAISRKREYLADASSALYTRYPEGLASALEKLAQVFNPGQIRQPGHGADVFCKSIPQ